MRQIEHSYVELSVPKSDFRCAAFFGVPKNKSTLNAIKWQQDFGQCYWGIPLPITRTVGVYHYTSVCPQAVCTIIIRVASSAQKSVEEPDLPLSVSRRSRHFFFSKSAVLDILVAGVVLVQAETEACGELRHVVSDGYHRKPL